MNYIKISISLTKACRINLDRLNNNLITPFIKLKYVSNRVVAKRQIFSCHQIRSISNIKDTSKNIFSLAPIPHQDLIIHANQILDKPAQFLGSVNDFERDSWPNKLNLPEVAFLGVSNAGKSTLINALLNSKGLAKTSKKPGHTKTLNLFQVGGRLVVVDMPGYGYKSRVEWGQTVENYLSSYNTPNRRLKIVYLLIESKRGFKLYDKLMVDKLEALKVPYQIIITKSDKLGPELWAPNFLDPKTSPLADYLFQNALCLKEKYLTFVAPTQRRFGIPQLRTQVLSACGLVPKRLANLESTGITIPTNLKSPSKFQRKQFGQGILSQAPDEEIEDFVVSTKDK